MTSKILLAIVSAFVLATASVRGWNGYDAGGRVGMMLVGRQGAEATILRAAHAFEQRVFGRPVPGAVSQPA